MHRVSEIVGKPVVSAESGESVGKVTDLLVDANGDRLVGVVVRRGMFGTEHVLPYTDVQAVGRDALVARSDHGVVGPREWHERHIDAARSSTLKDKRVVTNHGRQLGAVKDVYVDEHTGTIEGYEVEGRSFGGLVGRRSTLPRSQGVSIGPDAVIVSDDALPAAADAHDRQRFREG